MTLVRPSRYTASPTVTESGNLSSEKYRQPDSATTASHGAASGSVPVVVFIHPLIAVSEEAVVDRVVQVSEHVVVRPPGQCWPLHREVTDSGRLLRGRHRRTLVVSVGGKYISWRTVHTRLPLRLNMMPFAIARVSVLLGEDCS